MASDPKLVAMRAAMKAAGVDAFLVPSQDPHFSEYVPTCFERRMFISGFTGSAGTALVTHDEALLWTDGRYFLQAEQELGPEWTLMRGGQPGVPEPSKWLADKMAKDPESASTRTCTPSPKLAPSAPPSNPWEAPW
jgi:Xaa-Pro aminopeptidase